MPESNTSKLKIVNNSGFPFQIRVQEEVKKYTKQHGWLVYGDEHLWRAPTSSKEGFIDLVIKRESTRMAIECKRVGGDDPRWLFLAPKGTSGQGGNNAYILWGHKKQLKASYFGWNEFYAGPSCFMASHCTNRGRDHNQEPFLEKIASELAISLESLAEEEMQIIAKFGRRERSFYYIPTIVTTAALDVCEFQPDDVDLSTGQLNEDNVTFTNVKYVRFHKSLGTQYTSHKSISDLKEANIEGQRTIYIVNALHLNDFLESFEEPQPAGREFPWAYLDR